MNWIVASGGLVAVLVALLLPSGGVLGYVRLLVSLLVTLTVPGWLISTRIRGDSAAKLAFSFVFGCSVFALSGFVLSVFGVRWYAGVVFVVFVVALVVSVALSTNREQSFDGAVSWRFAVGLTLAVCGAATLTHLVLPGQPIESSISMQVQSVTVRAGEIVLVVDVDRIGQGSPSQLTLQVDGRALDSATASLGSSQVSLTAPVSHEFATICNNDVRVVADNGAYVSPGASMRCATTRTAL